MTGRNLIRKFGRGRFVEQIVSTDYLKISVNKSQILKILEE